LCIIPLFAYAQLLPAETYLIDPGSFTYIEEGIPDRSIHGGAWCYDSEANAVLITAPARQRAICKLKLKYEAERQKIKSEFQISNLKLRVETLTTQYNKIILIKDEEIKKLTAAALKRPNDYTIWWASGGFVAGVLLTTGIVLAINHE